ncbi:MAG: hypothetical protein A2Y07_03495 [Planctomycetes bacterium GWF2_50_10]|nr:MAG: hypothetical protein A2Y07_03495 [Planctomycetes bacterium GWF2_50_10]
MKNLLIYSVLFLFSGIAFGVDSNEPNTAKRGPGKAARAAAISVSGMIDNGLYKSIRRRTDAAIAKGATYIIYEVSTYGGDVESADNICKYLIHDVAPKARTVAYVTTEAISAGSMISVSCQDIIMKKNTTIGDSAPITMTGKLEGVEREKAESFIRAIFERAAEANNYPKPLLRAMVTDRIEVWRIKNVKTGKFEFFEGDRLPKDVNNWEMAAKELINSDKDILTLTASNAYEYGIARAVVENRAAAMAFLEGRDGVKFATDVPELRTNWSEEMVRWVNSPAVTSILFMLGLLGLYMELNSPGLGLPGLLAVVCFAILFGSKFLIGMANWVEALIFFVGVALLFVEVLILPGFGIAGMAGIILVIVGLLGMFVRNPPDKLPIPQTSYDVNRVVDGVLTLGAGFLGFLVLAWLISKHLPKSKLFAGLVLTSASTGGGPEVNMSAPPEAQVNVKMGDEGTALSTLRPSGKAKFGEAVVDVVAEGEFISPGSRIKIVLIEGVRVVVRKLIIDK